MIKYDVGPWGLCYILRLKGSVFPKALMWAVPNAALAAVLQMYMPENYTMAMSGIDKLWAGYTSVLGFLVVFRNNQAYTRFWEGATVLTQVRGEWFNAVSTAFAFCNAAEEHARSVHNFQLTLIALASLLYCSALQQVCELNDNTLDIIEVDGIDPSSIEFLTVCHDRVEIILQWIHRLLVDAEEKKIIKIAPPLLTRCFQELSQGIVGLTNARKIKDVPFPFPYAQMITVMLMAHWLATPVVAASLLESPLVAALMCLCATFAFWCLIYIALEIDQPFGEDANDLPLHDMMQDFNLSLLDLMKPAAQKIPSRPRGPRKAEPSRFTTVYNIISTQSTAAAAAADDDDSEDPEPPHDPSQFPAQICLVDPEAIACSIVDGGAISAVRPDASRAGADAVGSGKCAVQLESPIEPIDGQQVDDNDYLLTAAVAQSRLPTTLKLPEDAHDAESRQSEGASWSPRASHRSMSSAATEVDGGGRAAGRSAAPMPVSGHCALMRGAQPLHLAEPCAEVAAGSGEPGTAEADG